MCCLSLGSCSNGFFGVLIDQGQDPQDSTVVGLIMDQIPTPDLIALGPETLAVGGSHSAGSPLAFAHLQTCFSPHPLYPFGIYFPALAPQ
jgi:hypothetical protein